MTTEKPMSQRYDAFISYRHVFPDLQVARRLHQLLEKFRLPHSLRSVSEGDTPWRVFMDDMELPVSADLHTSILEALQRSRFLILLCSAQTPASPWVAQEVLDFARMHGWDHIVPVLIEGTPRTSFPLPLVQHGTVPYLNIAGEPNANRIVRQLKRSRAWLFQRLAGCEGTRLSTMVRRRDAMRWWLCVTCAVAALALFSFYALQFRDQAMEHRATALNMEAEAMQSAQLAQQKQTEFEDGVRAVEAAEKSRQENDMWGKLANMDKLLQEHNTLPMLTQISALIKEPGMNDAMRMRAEELIQAAQPTGALQPVLIESGEYIAGYTPNQQTLVINAFHDGAYSSYPTDTLIRRAFRVVGWGAMTQLEFNASSTSLVAGEHGTLMYLDPETLRTQRIFQYPQRHDRPDGSVMYNCTFLPGTEILYFGSANKTVCRYDGNFEDLQVPEFEFYQAVTPINGQWLIFSNPRVTEAGEFDRFALYDMNTRLLQPLPPILPDIRTQGSRDGKRLLLFGQASDTEPNAPNVYVFNREDATIAWSGRIRSFDGKNKVMASADLSSSGRYLLLNNIEQNEIEIIDLEKGKQLPPIPYRGEEVGYAVMCLDDTAVLYSQGKNLYLMDFATRKLIGQYENLHRTHVERMFLSPDGRQVVTTSNLELIVWQLHPELAKP